MKNSLLLLVFLLATAAGTAQINKDQLSLDISKAEEANLQKLKEYIWKRKSDVYLDEQLKLTILTEFSFDSLGKLQAKVVDADSKVEKKGGLRGRAQENAAEEKADYAEKALSIALQYTYMSKGELIDFFSKATVTEKDGLITAVAENVYVKGDKLTIHVDFKTKLFKYKEFSTKIDNKDPLDGKVNYETFQSSGISHVSATTLNMTAQKMKIEAKNQDYAKREK